LRVSKPEYLGSFGFAWILNLPSKATLTHDGQLTELVIAKLAGKYPQFFQERVNGKKVYSLEYLFI
jgi:hypothetical protein